MKKLFVLTLILSGCASQQGYWFKEGLTQDEYAKTKYLCLQQSQQPESKNLLSSNYSNAANSNVGAAQRASNAFMQGFTNGLEKNQTGMITNDTLFNACMNAQGIYWKTVNKP